MFKGFDIDNSDMLDEMQFKNLFIVIGYDNVDLGKFFKELDSDYNGKFLFVEFMKWLNWVLIEM